MQSLDYFAPPGLSAVGIKTRLETPDMSTLSLSAPGLRAFVHK